MDAGRQPGERAYQPARLRDGDRMPLTKVRLAWLWLVGALALHVIDEASTGFLDVYNPTVRELRERLGWFPMPEFRFGVWIVGLAVLVLGLLVLTPLVDRGLRTVRVATVAFAALMVLNGVGHITATIAGRTVATVQFERPMPGFWSSPLLMGAAILFIARARHGVYRG
jgi:hypothetical protein